jgi:uncharacterized membrane protein YkvA (DUF1232 family)
MAMIRLIRAYYRGEYRDISRQNFVIIVAAVLYFLTPADVISDWIPITGFVDDALVVSVALGAVRDDLDAFMGWETSQP